jgi:hypothetical protein
MPSIPMPVAMRQIIELPAKRKTSSRDAEAQEAPPCR